MILIACSLIGLLFDHGRVSAPVSLPDRVSPPSPLVMAVEQSPAIPLAIVNDALAEAAAIWQPLGVTLTWNAVDANAHPAAVRVIFTDDAAIGSPAPAEETLGWIRFWAPAAPEPVIHVSRTVAVQLL